MIFVFIKFECCINNVQVELSMNKRNIIMKDLSTQKELTKPLSLWGILAAWFSQDVIWNNLQRYAKICIK